MTTTKRRGRFSLTGRNRIRVQRIFASTLDNESAVVDDTAMNPIHTAPKRPSTEAIKAMTSAERAKIWRELVPGLAGRALDAWIQTGNGSREQLAGADAPDALPTVICTLRDKGRAYKYTTGDGEVITARSTRLYTHASVYRRHTKATYDRGEEGALIIFLHSRVDLAVKGASDAERICKTGAWERIPGVVTIKGCPTNALTPTEPDPDRAPAPTSSLTAPEPAAKLSPKDPTTPHRRTNKMPVAKAKPATKRAAPKTKAATAKKAAPARTRKAAPAATNGNGRISYEDKLALVPEIVKKLKSGVPFSQIRQEYTGSGWRAALAEKGYDVQGNKLTIEEISTAGGPKAFAKRVAAARAAGMPWFQVAIAAGRPRAELQQLLADHGYGDLASGRVTNEPEAKPTRAKAPAKKTAAKAAPATRAKPAAKAKPATKAKAKVSRAKPAAPAPAVKAKPRRVARRPQ
jgi:hypothetical protein